MRLSDWDSPEFAELSVQEKLETITAGAAANAAADGDGDAPDSVADVDAGAAFVIPLLIPEEMESGDGRQMDKDALSTRDLPISLLWQPSTGDGHNGSFIVGRIDSVERVDNGLGNARGVFDTGPYGREAERLVRAKMLRGVSADLDQFEATVDSGELAEEIDPARITNEKMVVNRARVMAATLVPKPAFQECTIELVTDDGLGDSIPMEDGVYEEMPPEAQSAEYTLSTVIASAAPVNPPSAWFTDPQLDSPTPLTVDDEGRVFGHIATWDTNHVGLSNGVRPPRSRSNYAYFRTGLVKTIEGEDIAVGNLTLLGGHAPLDASAQLAVKHYDDTQSAVADVTAGEDQFGIWVSGGLRPHVTPEQVRTFRASAPSGDWRPINGTLELVAVCQVNVPGFPVARARVASGAVMALVAAGTSTLHKIRTSEHDDLLARLSHVETMMLEQKKQALTAAFTDAREERVNRLREAAAKARETLAPELDKRAQMAARANEARQAIAEFKMQVVPDFKEALHPRDDDGKFKQVLLKLGDIVDGPESNPAAEHARDTLKRAVDLEEEGDSEGAAEEAEKARIEIETAADSTEGETSEKLAEVAEDIATAAGDAVTEVVKETAEDVAKGDLPADDAPGDIDIESIPPEIVEFIELMIDELGESVDPQTLLSRMSNQMRHWLEGAGFGSPEELARLISKMLEKPVQPDVIQ